MTLQAFTGFAGRLLGCLLWFMALAAQGQTLGDIDVITQGEMRIVRVRFNASVGFLQIAPAGPSDLYTLRFDLLAADESVLRQTVGESRRLGSADGLPEMTIAYSAEPGRGVRQLTVRLARALPVQARQGPNARSIELLLRVADITGRGATDHADIAHGTPAAAAPATPASGPAIDTTAAATAQASSEIEAQAAALMTQARQALDAKHGDAAVALLNALLKLPPNSQSVTAQELIGQAWELAGSPARARIEYGLYLRLYPQAEGAGRVAERLAALGGSAPAATSAAAPAREAPKRWSGSIAQYYYGGKAQTKSLVTIATGIDQATISHTTESAIVTSADISGRFTGESGETRAVLRGSSSSNLLAGGHSSNSIGSAYVEYRRSAPGLFEGLALRAGRQSPISGGLLGLFDGVSMSMPVGQGLKLDLMGGVPASALVSAPGERLLAAVLEADSFLERFGGNVYLLDQSSQGITNRRALGSELRYAGEQWSLNALFDYDTVFGKLNAVSLHGSLRVGTQTTVTMLLDERRAPSLQLTNALISSGAASLRELLQTRSLAQVKADALATSATARQVLLSVARPLDAHWQISTDLRYSAVGALPAVGDFEATPATGSQLGWTMQLTGTNLYSKRDIDNFNLSLLHTPFFRGVQFAVNNLTGIGGTDDLTLEPSLRVYWQRDTQDVKLLRWGPGIRLSWRTSRRGSLLGEVMYEASRTDGPSNHDNSRSAFFYLGYRYELF